MDGINYDQRGNLRSGVTVGTDSNGVTTYTYYKYNSLTNKWEEITVDAKGNTSSAEYTGKVKTSIGAFEPLFYVTVTSNGDDSNLLESDDTNAHYFEKALANGLTLREATYWIDTYKYYDDTTAANLGYKGNVYNDYLVKADINRYVKFDLAAASSNTITLTNQDVLIGGIILGNDIDKDIRLGVTPDGTWVADDDYVAQDSASRIVVSGNNAGRIFSIASGSTVLISNLTLTDGYARDTVHDTNGNGAEGKGGAIYNAGSAYLYNVVVKDSVATASGSATSAGGIYGLGGGIYNNGYMYLFDTTVTNNQAESVATSDYHIDRSGLGGGIYNAGTLYILNSAISYNSALGNITYANESVKGGGIYNAGSLTIANSTIYKNTLTATEAYVATKLSGEGAAIYNASGTLTLYYTTIVYNSAVLNASAAADPLKFVPGHYSAVAMEGGTLSISYSIAAQNTAYLTGDKTKLGLNDIWVRASATVDGSGNYNARYNIIGNASGTTDPVTDYGYDWSQYTTNVTGIAATNDVANYMAAIAAYNGGKTMVQMYS